jgi:5-methylcytosine-specific restriction endonuclease McrA
MAAKLRARSVYTGPNKRQKWEYKCEHCRQLFKGTEVQVDHIIPVGTLRCLEDIPGFVQRLTSEDPANYQVLCKPCHLVKTMSEKKNG